MAENFYTILTNTGKAKLANAQALGTTVQFSSIAVGDGSGNYYDPTESQTALKNEVWRGAINQIKTDSENPNWIIVEVVIPTSTGGFTVREAGIIDSEGDLIALGKYPATYKPALAEGSGKDLYIRMILEVSNTSVVTLKIDPAVVLSTRGYVDDSIAEHNTAPLAHGNLPYLKTSQAADFAPSGYGIGDYNGALIPNDDLDYAVKGGLYSVSGNTLNKPTGTSPYSVCVVLSREYTTNVIQLYVDRNHKLFIRNSTSAVPAGEPVSWDLWKQVDAGSISGKTLVDLVQKSELNAPGDAPYFVCRAWVHFNGADNLPTIHSQGNISSVTKQVTGIYTINFLNPMVDAHYVCSVASGGFMHAILEGATANSVSVSVKLANGADGDSVRTQIAIFR